MACVIFVGGEMKSTPVVLQPLGVVATRFVTEKRDHTGMKISMLSAWLSRAERVVIFVVSI